jgi:4-amino-4-deoxy-L-arabinose transferase-like glycosyltransferase
MGDREALGIAMSVVQRPDRHRVPPSWLARRTTNWLAGLESSPAPGRRLLPFLLLYLGVLTAFATFTFGWGPLHHDMTEAWAWGKEFQLGYAKHPPFTAWLVGGWFAVMPRTDWSFYLLASLNIGVGLAGVWMLAGVFFGTAGRLASVLFQVLTPSFSLWALKFNVNAPLVSTWPWTAYFFLKSLQTRSIGFSMSAGLLGGIALLTKYSSLVLFASLFVVALLHPDRRKYFASAAPYVSIAVGLLVVAPHVWWTVAADFPTVDYFLTKTHSSAAEAGATTIRAVIGGVASLAVAAIAYAIAFRGRCWALLERAVAGTFQARNAWLICLAHGPLLFTVAAYLFANVRITGGFLAPAFFAVPIVLLVVSQADVSIGVLRRLSYCVAAVWLSLLVASPFLGYRTFAHARELGLDPAREIAVEATSLWRSKFDRPLRYVSGEKRLATAATFYSPDAPSYIILEHPADSPWATIDQAKKMGLLIICPQTAQECINSGALISGRENVRTTRELAPHFFGLAGTPQRFVFIMRPPED